MGSEGDTTGLKALAAELAGPGRRGGGQARPRVSKSASFIQYLKSSRSTRCNTSRSCASSFLSASGCREHRVPRGSVRSSVGGRRHLHPQLCPRWAAGQWQAQPWGGGFVHPGAGEGQRMGGSGEQGDEQSRGPFSAGSPGRTHLPSRPSHRRPGRQLCPRLAEGAGGPTGRLWVFPVSGHVSGPTCFGVTGRCSHGEVRLASGVGESLAPQAGPGGALGDHVTLPGVALWTLPLPALSVPGRDFCHQDSFSGRCRGEDAGMLGSEAGGTGLGDFPHGETPAGSHPQPHTSCRGPPVGHQEGCSRFGVSRML